MRSFRSQTPKKAFAALFFPPFPVMDNETNQKSEKKKCSRRRKLLPVALCLFALAICGGALVIAGADLRVERCAAGRVYTNIEDIPVREYGLLLGTTRLVRGKYRNDYFYKRVRATAELYRAGKVRKIIVSGDNGRTEYNETGDMKRELVESGIPPEDILMDYAGFRTLDSVVRARNLYDATELTVISQEFHCERAVYLADRNGIDALGFAAEDSGVQSARVRLALRESLARVLAVLDAEILHRKPHFEY
jgi:SanA protein